MKKVLVMIIVFCTTAAQGQSTMSIADSLYAVGDYSGAIEILQSEVVLSGEVSLKLAKLYQAKGDLAIAKDYYEKVLQINPERVLATVNYADLLMQSGDLKLADSLFTNLVQKYPDNANFYYRLGQVKEKQKDSLAVPWFYKTIEIDSTHQQALSKISKEALKRGRYITAEKYSKQGLESNPNNIALISLLAQAYYHQHRYELAVGEFNKLLERNQGSKFVHTKLGMSYYRLGNIEEALQHYETALQYDDQDSSVHFNMGKLYAQTSELEKSEKHLLIAVLLKKQTVDAEFLSLAITYRLSKKYKKALEYLAWALEENPENERALYERAVAADNYYEDVQTIINFYNAYLDKYDAMGNESLILLAKNRRKDLREKLHMSQ